MPRRRHLYSVHRIVRFPDKTTHAIYLGKIRAATDAVAINRAIQIFPGRTLSVTPITTTPREF